MDLHRLCVNTIKGLAMDGVEAANSGHPGMPMGMADVATVLWTRFLNHDPADPHWPDRDRFVLSAGHGSMLIYSLLHLSGYGLPLDELKRFRQWGSKTPGHPEVGHTVGVETTTGPLGQGFANAVGMAIAERLLRETFGTELCDHWTYGICSDGDLMEGVSNEAASLAGHLGLGRLVLLYDDNHISIDGSTDIAFTEDRTGRLAAQGWHVQNIDGHDPEAIAAAIVAARAVTDKPSLIACRTFIGHGSRLQGSAKTHGAPLGKEEIRWVKTSLGMDPDASFVVPAEVPPEFQKGEGKARRAAWEARMAEHPRAAEYREWLARDGAALVKRAAWPTYNPGDKAIATRAVSELCLKAASNAAPWFIGGSADLAESNKTHTGKPIATREKFAGAQTIAFGVREHGMAAITNGIVLHGGFLPYCATFLIFHDYMRPSCRLAALMEQPVTYIYTHDSFWLGEDGPTHQPIETLLAMRAIHNFAVVRPADAKEAVAAWKFAITRTKHPTALSLTRQGLPTLAGTGSEASTIEQGAYTIVDVPNPRVVLIGTGSEVQLCVGAAEKLAADGIAARVVSMPWREGFMARPAAERETVLPRGVPRVAVEAGVTLGWERVVGDTGKILGIDHFGASAPDKVLAEKFGFTVDNVVAHAKAAIG